MDGYSIPNTAIFPLYSFIWFHFSEIVFLTEVQLMFDVVSVHHGVLIELTDLSFVIVTLEPLVLIHCDLC